jgi:hypothetical protein
MNFSLSRFAVALPVTLLLATASLVANQARAENVDLSTVPARDTVQLTIYNSEDLTLVRETRVVTFKRGANPLQFSWAGTLIDASSVELTFLTSPDKLEVLDTTFPHDKPEMLYWNVDSELDGEATIQISYFTSGITWSADYVAIANQDEQAVAIDGFVRVTNNSGEDYEGAQVRLVVGTINLVEKIAQLAQVPMEDVAKLARDEADGLYATAARSAMGRGGFDGGMGGGAPASAAALEEKEVIKEGLSEYFIYTIEGTETIPNGWSKRMRSFDAANVPVKIQYRYRPQEYGEQLVRMYLMTNNEESKLGSTPLPDGVVRVFRDNGRDGLTFLVAQPIKYVPIGDKIELNLGQDPEVIFELIKLRALRDNIWLQVNGENRYEQVGRGVTQTEPNRTVAGWDDRSVFTQRVRNYSGRDIDVEIRRAYDGDIVFRSQLEPVLHDYRTAQFSAKAPRGEQTDLLFEIIQRQGYNAKQSHVTIEAGDVRR